MARVRRDVSWSRAYFTGVESANRFVPEAVGTVLSGGASVDNFHRAFGSLRLRYFGPRTLLEDDSVRSKATSLVNLNGGRASRLRGEPAGGVEDIHFHPAVPRTARVSLTLSF